MMVQFSDVDSGVPVYVNPAFVVSMRPDAKEPTRVTVVQLRNGETLRVAGGHEVVADKLAAVAA
jgi:hypothetical protein